LLNFDLEEHWPICPHRSSNALLICSFALCSLYIWKYELDLTWGCITSTRQFLGTRQFYGCYCRAKRARVRCTIKHHTGGEHSAACRCACVCKGEGASTRKPEASPQEQNIVAATATFTVASAPRALRGCERTTRAAQASRRTLLFPPLKPPSPPGTAATAFAAAAASAAIKNIPERYPPPRRRVWDACQHAAARYCCRRRRHCRPDAAAATAAADASAAAAPQSRNEAHWFDQVAHATQPLRWQGPLRRRRRRR